MANEQFKAQILYKLLNHRYWGGKHTQKRNALKGVPPRLYDEFEDALEELIKSGLVMAYPKTKDIHISLNPRKSSEIFDVVERWFSRDIVDPYK